MTTTDQMRPAAVDPLVLTATAGPGQRAGALALDLLTPVVCAALATILFMLGHAALGWALALAAAVAVALTVRALARSGRSLGSLAARTRTVRRSTGAAAGASLSSALFTRDLATVDLARGRDPFAAALATFEFPQAAPVPHAPTRAQPPLVELDSGERFSLTSALVLGRAPSAPLDAPAELYQWADLSRTLSKSHARIEWDGHVVWATDLGSTNGTVLRTAAGPQLLLPFQRTPIPVGAPLELGDRAVTVRAPA